MLKQNTKKSYLCNINANKCNGRCLKLRCCLFDGGKTILTYSASQSQEKFALPLYLAEFKTPPLFYLNSKHCYPSHQTRRTGYRDALSLVILPVFVTISIIIRKLPLLDTTEHLFSCSVIFA